jgi:ABC-type amino acid transport substrate-binding protein
MTQLRTLSRRQWLLIAAGAILLMTVGRPAGRWLWLWQLLRPLPEQPMLPYGELRVGIDASYPPFGIDVDGELIGLDVDLAVEVAERLDIPLRFINMGYDGLYDSLQADQVDALFSALRVDPLRTHIARYTISYFEAGQMLIRPPDAPINRMADLEGRVLAVEFGTEGDIEARAWQRRLSILNVTPYNTAEDALAAVASGEADATLVDAIAARLWLRENDDLTPAPDYVTHDPYAVAVQIDNVKLWEAIDETLKAMHADGTLETIIARWL